MNKNLIFIILLLVLIFYINNSNLENFKPMVHKNNFQNKKLPPGNWHTSCQLLDFRYPVIWAECKNKKGIYKPASKNLLSCLSKNLSNIDGELHCDN
jgi:hypothetical protein